MSFEVAATAYDRFMGRFSRPLGGAFVEWAFTGADAAVSALDVGCGPGALTEVLAARLGAASVTAVDPSPQFVAAARERMPGVRVLEASAEALPFEDGSFEAAFAQLVVHFMSDPAAGIGEMRRVTRPGGVVAANVWDFQNQRAPQSLFFRALRDVMPDVDDEVTRAGARRGDLAALLTGAGCAGVEQSELSVSVEFASFADWWEPYTLGVGPAGAQLARLDAQTREAVRRRCAELLPDGPFRIDAVAWAAKGTA
ncbi:class I SAM-dependent methyltransferase [Microbacterium sp. DT81.1]|uniref:class I SAM-dependent methyltransferase n=1 Tax=Microbacterium sp. DT81.1 TaxID=3393413 RepID=UPI003CF078B7